jgi:hypothetical protein
VKQGAVTVARLGVQEGVSCTGSNPSQDSRSFLSLSSCRSSLARAPALCVRKGSCGDEAMNSDGERPQPRIG